MESSGRPVFVSFFLLKKKDTFDNDLNAAAVE
jgi:hypothetical protein